MIGASIATVYNVLLCDGIACMYLCKQSFRLDIRFLDWWASFSLDEQKVMAQVHIRLVSKTVQLGRVIHASTSIDIGERLFFTILTFFRIYEMYMAETCTAYRGGPEMQSTHARAGRLCPSIHHLRISTVVN